MISNFNEVEKSLKRCLKEKVSITTATVVGFLIAGTVAFGGTYDTDSFKAKVNGKGSNFNGLEIKEESKLEGVMYEYVKATDDTIKYLITANEEGATLNLDKDTKISTKDNLTLLNIYKTTAENNGILENTSTEGYKSTVIVNGKDGNASFINNGTITKTGHPEYNCAIDLSSLEGKTATLTNTGKITGLIQTDSKVTGNVVINLEDKSDIEGNLYFAGGGTRTINIDNNTDDLTINNTDDNETFVRTNNSDITLRGEIQSKGTTVELNNKDGNNTLTNYADIIGKTGIGTADEGMDTSEAAKDRTLKIINHGNITSSVYGIYNNGYYTKYNKTYIENNGDILVNGVEKTTSGDKLFWYNTGIYSASAPYTETPGKVVNNGNITIDLTKDQQTELKEKYAADGDMFLNIHGLRLHEHTEGYNNGKILVNSYRGVGVVLSDGDETANALEGVYGYFENNGTIEVNGENGIGVQLRNKEGITAKKEAINTEKGSILVSGMNAIGVRVEGASTTFTNNGIIELKDGTTNGVGISIDKGTAVNNGTIALEIGTIENSNKNIAIANKDGIAKNAGKIQITDKTAEELKGTDFSSLFTGNYINSGMLVDRDGIAIEKKNDVEVGGDNVTSDTINNAGKENEGSSIVIKDDTTITASNDPIEVDSLNVTGTVTIANGTEGNKPVEIKGATTNLDAKGSLAIGNGDVKADLKITGGTVNGTKDKEAVTFAATESTLTLAGTTFSGNIGTGTETGKLITEGTDATVITGDVKAKTLELAGTTAITGNIETTSMALSGTTAITGDITTGTMNVTAGETKIDGKITGAKTITIGNDLETDSFALKAADTPSSVPENATVTYSANSAIKGKQLGEETAVIDDANGTTITIEANGMLQAEVDNTGKYVFSNSNDVTVKGDGKVQLLTSNINKKTLELKEGSNIDLSGIGIIGNDFYSYDRSSNTLTYDFKVNNKILSDISSKSFVVHNVLSQDPNVREAQFDSIYSNGVYSETVKMAMDTLRMNEDAVLSLGGKPEEGRWTAQGKMLFSRTEYDRTGVIRDFGVETRTTGLLGALEYGVSEKSSVGFAFSGSKQDLDMKNASADGDAFYFGVYGKQDVNNFKLTAGLGYQLDKIDADNNVMVSTGDKYDSKAFSGYAQGKYVINAGNDVTVEPKLKLALTRLTQESAKDKHFEMEKVEATTFDTEVGVDLVKTVKLESGKMNLLAGISYTRSMGDTDNKFKGNFVGTDGTKGERFDVLGANLGENTLKINIGAEVEKDNGFFYNGGLNYKFDNEDRETFGATIGAGYKF